MTIVLNIEEALKDVPRLQFRIEFAEQSHSLGRTIIESRRMAAKALAEKIVKEGKFFKTEQVGTAGTVTADVVVLTMDELAAIMRGQFRKGIDHAAGFHWNNDELSSLINSA